jgi:hypothetical protein
MTNQTATEATISRAIKAVTRATRTGPATWWVDRTRVAVVFMAITGQDDALDDFAQWFDRSGTVGFIVHESMATVVEDFRAEVAEVNELAKST